jgi:hypothetical protein
VDHLLVPHEASTTTARIWVGRFGADQPVGLRLAVGPAPPSPIPAAWQPHVIDGAVRLWSQRHVLTGLAPGQGQPVRLLDGDLEVASAVVTTLPERLPLLDERPFTCLLGSCFGWDGDPFGREVGAAVRQLPALHRPDVTFLCGDQVYLDAPFPRYLHHLPGGEGLRLELFEKYRANWAPPDQGAGYSELLRQGATYFTADDHELWNNAPNKTPVVLKTWFGPWRQEWYDAASELYDRFQSPSRIMSFGVDRLSFLVADLRLDRAADRSRVQSDPDHRRVIAWIDGLPGPGVLVLGQPMLVAEAGWKGNIADWGLPDYRQYGPLVAAIQRSRHDIVVLTGDVHFGRVAGATLPSGANLYEVIASPFALVTPLLPQRWAAPPERFPASLLPGTVGCPVWSRDDYKVEADHFATVAFRDAGGRLVMHVTAWVIPPLGGRLQAGPQWGTYLN